MNELELLIHRHYDDLVKMAVIEFWDKLMDATQMSCSGIFDWVDEC